MERLTDDDVIKMANEAKKKAIYNNTKYSARDLKESGNKLEGKKVVKRKLTIKPRFYLLVGTAALAGILIGTTYSQSKDDLIRKKGGKVSMDRDGNVTTIMPQGVEEPTPIEVITNIVEVVKDGFSKGGR